MLTQVLEEALQLLDSKHTAGSLTDSSEGIQLSLIDQCIELCQQGALSNTEPVRTIHHLSCTGGTLIAKCLAAMPNVIVLNEVDPLSNIMHFPENPLFTPTDMVSLLRQGDVNVQDDLLIRIFTNNLAIIRDKYSTIGKRVILRDHSHSHFLTGNISKRPSLRVILKGIIPTLPLVTVRDPVDSYLSLCNNITNNGWNNGILFSFYEYCLRYHQFLDEYDGVRIVKYEDFVGNPQAVMMEICSELSLTYADHFEDTFDIFKFSGDSGRSGSMIKRRGRRAVSDKLISGCDNLATYIDLIDRLGYRHFMANGD